MLTLCGAAETLAFLPPDPYAARISALAKTYGFARPFALFWVQTVQGAPVAAISRVDGHTTLCALPGADVEELRLFLQAVGFESLLCDAALLPALDLTAADSAWTVEYRGDAPVPDPAVRSADDLRAVHALLCAAEFPVGPFPAFAADLGARLQAGTASMTLLGDPPVSCAGRLFRGAGCDLLGAVATDPAARGRGYATRLVRQLAGEGVAAGQRVFLFCREDGLLPFYEAMGFAAAGRWAQCGGKE